MPIANRTETRFNIDLGKSAKEILEWYEKQPLKIQREFDSEKIRVQELDQAEYFENISLYDFTKEFWPVIEPSAFIDGWHIGCYAEHLTACYERQIRNLLINVPPRHTKSGEISQMFPAWVWTKNPATGFLTSSFAEKLALRDAMNSRTIIDSPLYQLHYRKKFSLLDDQNTKSSYKNNERGYRISFGVKSSIVGEGGDINICDDPNNPQKSEEAADRIETNYWLTKKWYTRVNDPNTAVRIIVQQRTHENDATGYILAEELGFELLKIPLEYKGKKYVTSIGWQDPRETLDELICPERFPVEEVKMWKKSLGTEASGQLQQEPIPQEGGMFNPSKIQQNFITDEQIPNNLFLVRYWDKAFTEGGGAYTAGVLIGKDFKTLNWYILDCVRGQWEPTFRDRMILDTAIKDRDKYRGRVRIRIEQEPGSAGRDANKILISSVLLGFPVASDPATGDKVTRAASLSSQWGAGNVYILKGEWNTDYLNELALFPKGKFKDQTDASSGGFNIIARMNVI